MHVLEASSQRCHHHDVIRMTSLMLIGLKLMHAWELLASVLPSPVIINCDVISMTPLQVNNEKVLQSL